MIRGVAFQTKARTVDHLGREQIADCPTAISELWKNSFDAYARRVELNIYGGDQPVAVISDDGHGMNREEFEGRWLVVGTESKATVDRTPVEDRNGLYVRPRQGQKGIGRLSCANLGPILLLVSKRERNSFVAALVDWRLFENPFINLSDVYIPVTEFEEQQALFEQLPELVAQLLQNVTGGEDQARADRLTEAWAAYDRLYEEELRDGGSNKLRPPSQDVRATISQIQFEPSHLNEWPVWTGEKPSGTALMVSHINFDLQVQLDEELGDSSARAAKDRFFETLSSFVDPFIDPSQTQVILRNPPFEYAVRAWTKGVPRLIVGSEKQFDRGLLDNLEHRIEGRIDADGVFTGRIRAFGQWLTDVSVIEPPKDLNIPRRADTEVGPLDLYIASMEFVQSSTTHDRLEFQRFRELAERYSGFMIFRDGLRVLPYGRTDNDFFEIESRRSKNAGREFWNHRQMFGRLAISREFNPNLKDKAGREGLLDNRAAKTLKELVANILRQSARRYFGSASDMREEFLPQIQETNRKGRADDARNKLRQRQRKEFRTKLQSYSQDLPKFLREVETFATNLNIGSESQISDAQMVLEQYKERVADYRLSGAPKSLGALEDTYAEYRDLMRSTISSIDGLSEDIDRQIERVNPIQPRALLEKQLARNAAQIHHRIQGWRRAIDALQKTEFGRMRELVSQRNKVFHTEATPLLHRFETGELTYAEVSKAMELLRQQLDQDNANLFIPYIGALESLKESIDLEHLASFGMEELSDLRAELERLNSLAQLGIAVEIVGHELQSYDDIIGSGLRRLPEEVRSSSAAKDIEFGYEGLTDQLRFLSPLRLAGQKIQRWIEGTEIADYLAEFFKLNLAKNRISMEATARFRAIKIFDQQSRLFPVFINLLNNSIYWVATSSSLDRRIVMDVLGSEVVVSDNGPGVDGEDVESLFSLFFTKKARGGRGVGLYLSRANLSAGGHRIRYEPNTDSMPLKGANFVMEFKGAEFDGE